MYNNALHSFVENRLIPAMYERIDALFPSLAFKRSGRGWKSPKHPDGTPDGKGEGMHIYPNTPFCVIDYARGKKGLIRLYEELFCANLKPIAAIKHIAEKCGLLDEFNASVSTDDGRSYEAYEAEAKATEDAYNEMRTALYGERTPEAAELQDYLINTRKWTIEEVKAAGLAMITPAIIAKYSKQCAALEGLPSGVGTSHTLAIPYYSGSRLIGFKFRDIHHTPEDKAPKYYNSKGLKKGDNLFGLPIYLTEDKQRDITIVEGELDALHASAKGMRNIVATAGGAITANQVANATARGVGVFTLLFDSDKAGRDFIDQSAATIQRMTGKSCFVATIPEGAKDLDEFLINHTPEEYDSEVSLKAVNYYSYKAKNVCNDWVKRLSEEGKTKETAKDERQLFDQLEKLYNSAPHTDKHHISERIKAAIDPSSQTDPVAAFLRYLDEHDQRQREYQAAQLVRKATEDAHQAIDAGDTATAIKLLDEATQKAKIQSNETAYVATFQPMTFEEVGNLIGSRKLGIPTGYKFGTDELTINTGLTFVCANTGHGKTSFLNCLAIDEAKRSSREAEGKHVLYFSYEIAKAQLLTNLINLYVGIKDLNAESHESNAEAITRYFRGERAAINPQRFNDYEERMRFFVSHYISSGLLTIVDVPYPVESLLPAIQWYINKAGGAQNVSMVCIDYAQLITAEATQRQRTEEIKYIVNQIKDFANKEGIAFVLAAQFNRQVETPLDLTSRNIGEGGDFERIADTCIGLFNLKQLDEEGRNASRNAIARAYGYGPNKITGLTLEKFEIQNENSYNGLMFARLMKRRGGRFPIDQIWGWEGETQRVTHNNEKYDNDSDS